MSERKSLKDISWLVDETTYRNDNALSYSKLSSFFKQGPKALISTEKVDTPALRFGSLVDTILTAPEEFDDKFYVADIDKFSDTIRKIVEDLFNPEIESIGLIDDATILMVLDNYQYQTNWKSQTRIDKVVALGEDYYTVLRYSTDKIVISPKEFEEAQQCVMTLKTHPFTYQIFDCNEDEEIFYQLKFKHTSGQINVRIMTDVIKVNHKEKWIQPYDLKTTGKNEEEFEKSFVDWNYWIQSGMYARVIAKNVAKDDYFSEFNILPFKFIVINRANLTPLVWEVNEVYIWDEIVKKYSTSWKRLLLDANWHLQNGKFDYSRRSYENKGVNPIVLRL